MKFIVEYSSVKDDRELVYFKDECSFYTTNCDVQHVDTEVIINTLSLSFIKNEIYSIDGYLGFASNSSFGYEVIETSIIMSNNYKQGNVIIKAGQNLDEDIHVLDIPTIYIDKKRGILCIGDINSNASYEVECIKNCIMHIDNDNNLIAIFIKLNLTNSFDVL